VRDVAQGMSYPSFEEYTDALRLPPGAIFQDPLLAGGSVRRNSAGVPFARSGNFALTYEVTVNGSRYAVRCFHKESDSLERRYEAISRKLGSIASPWFMDFEFQPEGIRTESGQFPIVRMRWADGCSLAQFISEHRDEPRTLLQLRDTLRGLARHLQAHDIAHGDIQPGNIIVQSATQLKLVDYDGMFVPELEPWGSTELGQRNFQHPGRSWLHYDERLDRFSFAVLDVVLEALAMQPALWELTGSDEAGIVLRASDFVDPAASTAFGVLAELDGLAVRARQLAALCRSPFERVPALDDFLAGRRIPAASAFTLTSALTGAKPAYIPAYAVLNATNFARCCAHIGDRIELIGRVRRIVSEGVPDALRSSLRVEFGDAREDMVQLSIWPNACGSGRDDLATLAPGQWLSAIGLVDPILTESNGDQPYKSVSIAITEPSQLRALTEAEALHRLAAIDGPSRSDHDISVTIGTDPAIPGVIARPLPPTPEATSACDVAHATPTIVLPQVPEAPPSPNGPLGAPAEGTSAPAAIVTPPVVTTPVLTKPIVSAPVDAPSVAAPPAVPRAAPPVSRPATPLAPPPPVFRPTASPAPPEPVSRPAAPPAPPAPASRPASRPGTPPSPSSRAHARSSSRRFPGTLRWPAIRWPAIRWPAIRWPAIRWQALRWPAVRLPAINWPAMRWPSLRWPAGYRPSKASLAATWAKLRRSLPATPSLQIGKLLPRLRDAVRGVRIPAGLPLQLRAVHPAWWLAALLMVVVLAQSWIIASRLDTDRVTADDARATDVLEPAAIPRDSKDADASRKPAGETDVVGRRSIPARGEPTSPAPVAAVTGPAAAAISDPRLRQGTRLLAFEDLRSARRPIATIAGPIDIVARGGSPRLSLVAVNGTALEESGAEINVLAHRSVYADREVIVGFSNCASATPACERKEPFWLLLRKSKPPVFKRSRGLRANRNAGSVTAMPSGLHVDLGLWDGVRQTATLTSFDEIYVTRVKEPPAPLSDADCRAVAAALDSCAASRACGSYESIIRSVPSARMATIQRLFHESTGLNASMFRTVCVRSCELGLTPTDRLVRREVCGGAMANQWAQVMLDNREPT
jgi:hypothetical protein